MTVKKNQTLTLDITDMAFGGRGIAKVDGLAVFVDQTVPGDRVEALIVKKKKNFAEARVVELLSASPYRLTPPCPYSGHCGGCKWQFIDYARQLAYKQRHVAESLAHIGAIREVLVHPVIPSEPVFGYRNKMEFSCAERRWLLPAELGQEEIEPGFALGLHVPGTFHKVLDIEACLLQPSAGNALLRDVREHIRGSGVPVYGLRTHQGFWRFLVLRHSVAHDQWMVNIVTATEEPGPVRALAETLMGRYPNLVSVVNNITARTSGVAVGEREVLLSGAPVIKERIGELEFEISANSFFQTNTRGATRLYETVKALAMLQGDETLWDLYCGTGTISLYLAKAARQVIGIELNPAAIADAGKNRGHNQVSNCDFIQGDMREALARIAGRPDVLVIDPPRVGLHAEVTRQVLQLAPRRIVYVSCNPATLARDLSLLKSTYEVAEVQPVDMFPHTYHIESVARLEKITH